jgi:uncharacterized membrane-anchored protein YhcB (DUF1043 family)
MADPEKLAPIGAIVALIITAVIAWLTARHRGQQVQEARVERDVEKERADHGEDKERVAKLTDAEAKAELDKLLKRNGK